MIVGVFLLVVAEILFEPSEEAIHGSRTSFISLSLELTPKLETIATSL